MALQKSGKSDTPHPAPGGVQFWKTSSQLLSEGWRQAQGSWNTAARGWGEVTGAWLSQFTRFNKAIEVLREPQEAAFAVAQAGLRLPFVLVGCAQPGELQDAVTRLAQVQGRAYQSWLEALTRNGAAAPPSEAVKSEENEKRRLRNVKGKRAASKAGKLRQPSPRS